MVERWDHLLRLMALHRESCSALALVRSRNGPRRAVFEAVAEQERQLAGMLAATAMGPGSPRDVRAAARRYVQSVAQFLA